MISLMMTGPTFGYAFAAPAPVRKSVTSFVGLCAVTLVPKLNALIAA